jgi:hypothetical protein
MKKFIIAGVVALSIAVAAPQSAHASVIGDIINFLTGGSPASGVSVTLDASSPLNRIVQISKTAPTNNVLLAKFDLKSQGVAGTLKQLIVDVTGTSSDGGTASLQGTYMNWVTISINGNTYKYSGWANGHAGFSNLNEVLPADQSVTVSVYGNFNADDGTLSIPAEGTKINVKLVATDTDTSPTGINPRVVDANAQLLHVNPAIITANSLALTSSDVIVSGSSVSLGNTISANNSTVGQNVTFTFTLTAGANTVYFSKQTGLSLATSSTGLSSLNATNIYGGGLASANPGSISGDSNVGWGYYVIPAGSSRTFTLPGVIMWQNTPVGPKTLQIDAIKYGTQTSALTANRVTVGLQNLKAVATGGDGGGTTSGVVSATLNATSPLRSIFQISKTSTTNNIVLAKYDVKSSTAGTLRSVTIRFNAKNASVTSLFKTLKLGINGATYTGEVVGVQTLTNSIDIFFSNLNVVLSPNQFATMTILGDVNADTNGSLSGAIASTSLVARETNPRVVDLSGQTLPVNNAILASNDLTFTSSDVVVSNLSASEGSPVIVASTGQVVAQNTVFSFTITAGNNTLYLSANPALALKTSSTGLPTGAVSIPQYGVTATPGTISGDSNTTQVSGYYVIPAGSSRKFSFLASIDFRNTAFGLKTLQIDAINYGTRAYYGSDLYSNTISNGLEALKVSVTGGNEGGTGGTSTTTVKILSPNGGEVLAERKANTISWTGGKQRVIVGVVDSNYETSGTPVGWIALNASPNSSTIWNGWTVTDLSGTTVSELKTLSPGPYRIIAVSLSDSGKYCLKTDGAIPCNVDLSNSSFTITPSIGTNPVSVTASFIAGSSDDHAGGWGVFAPGAGNFNKDRADWRWNLNVNGSGKSIKRITIIHNTRGEVWSTGYSRYLGDGADLFGYNEHPYPLVVMIGSGQANSSYDDNTLGPISIPAVLQVYGQRESTKFAGGEVVVEFTDGTEAKALIAAGTTTPTTSSVVISNTSASLGTAVKNSSGSIISYPVSFNFTLTAGNSPIYLSVSATTFAAKGGNITPIKGGIHADPTILSGDSLGGFPSDYYIVPAGSSRQFTSSGTLTSLGSTYGNMPAQVTSIQYGTSPSSLKTYSITSGLGNLVVSAPFNGNSSPTSSPTPTATESTLPDLSITSVNCNTSTPTPHQPITCSVTVYNNSSTPVNKPIGVNIQGTVVTINSIGAFETKTSPNSPYPFAFDGLGEVKLNFVVDGASEIPESNENNNVVSKTFTVVADSVSCPTGYTCVPTGTSYSCPDGYACTPQTYSCPSGYTCSTAARIVTASPTPSPTPSPSPTPAVTTQTQVNGSCGSAVNSCSTGTYSDQTDSSSSYIWSCMGSNGGTGATCSASKPTTVTSPSPTPRASSSPSPVSYGDTRQLGLLGTVFYSMGDAVDKVLGW